MCGLVGMAGDFNYRAKDLLKEMLVVASLRGKDSTGVAGINIKTNEAKLVKVVGNPFDLFEYRPFDRISSHDQSVLIGHCRHATRGGVSRMNAHPFDMGEVVGAHNGTLSYPYGLARDLGVDEYGTDSETFYAGVAKHGIREAVSRIDGAYALTWWNRKERTFNILRNNQRQLWIAYSDGMKQLYWASEWWMLEGLLNRNDIKLFQNKEGHSIFLVPVDTLFTFKVPENGSAKIECVNEEEVKGNEKKQSYRVPFQWDHDDGANAGEVQVPLLKKPDNLPNNGITVPNQAATQNQGGSGTTPSSSKASTPSGAKTNSSGSTKSSRQSKPTLTLVQTDKKDTSGGQKLVGPGGREISKAEFEVLIKNGCQWCSATLEAEDKVTWLPSSDGYIPICEECSDPGSDFQRYMNG